MDAFVLLEQKVSAMVAMVKELTQENELLREEQSRYRERVEILEHSLLSRTEHAEERSHELVAALSIVDKLIENIDQVIQNHHHTQSVSGEDVESHTILSEQS